MALHYYYHYDGLGSVVTGPAQIQGEGHLFLEGGKFVPNSEVIDWLGDIVPWNRRTNEYIDMVDRGL